VIVRGSVDENFPVLSFGSFDPLDIFCGFCGANIWDVLRAKNDSQIQACIVACRLVRRAFNDSAKDALTSDEVSVPVGNDPCIKQ
jgi:hypothetical protein